MRTIVLALLLSLFMLSIGGAAMAASKPDALIKGPAEAAYIGGGIYNTLAGQTVTALVGRSAPISAWLRIENDGDATDFFMATGTGNGDGWTVRFFDALGLDRTALFTSGQAVFQLAPGAFVEARLEITADPNVAAQPNRAFTLAVVGLASRQSDAVVGLAVRRGPLTAVKLTGPSSPLPEGLPIMLEALPTGGDNLQYRFLARPSTQAAYTVLRDWGGPTYGDWHPTVSSTQYIVKAQAREIGGTAVRDSNALYYVVKPAVTALTLVGSPASPSSVGRKVVLTAVAVNGANLQYKFVTTKQGTAPVDTYTRDYAAGRSTWWTPTEAGTYTVTAYAKEVAGGAPTTATATYEIRPAVSALALKVNNPPAMPDGTYRTVTNMSVTLQATPTGGANLEYWWQVGYRPNAASPTTWDTATYAYGKVGGIIVVKPAAIGFYYFTAYAREKGTSVGAGSSTVRVQVNAPVSSYAAAFTRNPSNGVVTIKVTSIVGGAAPQWKVWVRKQGTLIWGTPSQYDLSNLIYWTPAEPGVYEVSIAVKELGSKATAFDLKLNPFTYTVQ